MANILADPNNIALILGITIIGLSVFLFATSGSKAIIWVILSTGVVVVSLSIYLKHMTKGKAPISFDMM